MWQEFEVSIQDFDGKTREWKRRQHAFGPNQIYENEANET